MKTGARVMEQFTIVTPQLLTETPPAVSGRVRNLARQAST
jgi:hypothetical protein